MEDSILLSIKKVLGAQSMLDDFDDDIKMHINSALMILRQLGIGPATGFSIHGSEETWSDFLGEDESLLEMVKSYVAMKVRIIFDPPVGGALDALKSSIAEFEWRLNVAVDPVRW